MTPTIPLMVAAALLKELQDRVADGDFTASELQDLQAALDKQATIIKAEYFARAGRSMDEVIH